ncbi:hypothetical protein [Anabaena sp. CCY 0017]
MVILLLKLFLGVELPVLSFSGMDAAQKSALKNLGAVEREKSDRS